MADAARSRAERIQRTEARALEAFGRSTSRLFPDRGVAVEAIAGGVAVFAGAASHLTRTCGIGMEGEVSAAVFDRLERFFRLRGATPRVDHCPFAHPSLGRHFAARRYRPALEFSLLWTAPGARSGPDDASIEVRALAPDEEALWCGTVVAGFGGAPEWEESLELPRAQFSARGALGFLACVDGEPAGGGALFVVEGAALLFSTTTRPEHRRRGVHAALIRARLRHAWDAGCEIAYARTRVGSDSQRNLERQGFALAYTFPTLEGEGTEATRTAG